MKKSTALCLAVLTVIFASSTKFSTAFPSASPRQISSDLNLFEDIRSLPCEDEADKYFCFYEVALEEACDIKPFKMMKQCRYSCNFCKK